MKTLTVVLTIPFLILGFLYSVVVIGFKSGRLAYERVIDRDA